MSDRSPAQNQERWPLSCRGSLAPIVVGYIGCIVIRPDGSRYLARAVPDPLAQQQD